MKISAEFKAGLLAGVSCVDTRAPMVIGIMHSLWSHGDVLSAETVSSQLATARQHAEAMLNAIEAAERAMSAEPVRVAA